MSITIHGMGTIRTHRPLWLAHEMGLEFAHNAIGPRTGETMEPEFLALNPRHKVPVLQHGDVILTESTAIMTYMVETFPVPDHIYVPGDALARARHQEWCFFVMSELDANGIYTIRRHKYLKHIYGDAPVAVESAREYFSHQIECMAGPLGEMAPFLFGEKLSVADILLTSCLALAPEYEIPLPQNMTDYCGMMQARQAYKDASAQNNG
ncbi:MAG: glutathione S-transferase family protein [Pseudomonadota bacterium]